MRRHKRCKEIDYGGYGDVTLKRHTHEGVSCLYLATILHRIEIVRILVEGGQDNRYSTSHWA
jgi:hypothetical protein